jgi:hypothetical protein
VQHADPQQFAEQPDEQPELSAAEAIDILLSVLSDGLDHPELWAVMPQFMDGVADLIPALQARLTTEHAKPVRSSLLVLLAICGAHLGQTATMLDKLQPLAVENSQSPLVQGAIFYLQGLLDPENPKYQLQGKICATPFQQLDVLERSTHQCCASWLKTSAGDLSTNKWQDVWNSPTAQAIRASMMDGSYRYCNKIACPRIQASHWTPETDLAQNPGWAETVAEGRTEVTQGPEVVNLAYDRTCNLSCPSCRTERFAANDVERAKFDRMQERAILPMLKNAKRVMVTGSGDPFASKNFRRLLEQLTPEEYPELRFQVMTNGMLFTPAQWANFPTLHCRTAVLKISVDAATGATHELLRRGARWPVVLENMKFAGELTKAGLIDNFDLVFVVQAENFREMGDAVDLAHEVGATCVYFARITNWGTFTDDQYLAKSVFLPTHSEHEEFLQAMQDPRLLDPIAFLGDLLPFVGEGTKLAA